MKTLRLNLKKEWYEMIESGTKKEEYRELKYYWSKRLLKNFPVMWRVMMDMCIENGNFEPMVDKELHPEYETVTFVYGYTKRTMEFKLDVVTIGEGKPEWGAIPGQKYFVIHIGERIN